MEVAIGVVLSLAVTGFAAAIGLDRGRAFDVTAAGVLAALLMTRSRLSARPS